MDFSVLFSASRSVARGEDLRDEPMGEKTVVGAVARECGGVSRVEVLGGNVGPGAVNGVEEAELSPSGPPGRKMIGEGLGDAGVLLGI